jgi:hypothetical protein
VSTLGRTTATRSPAASASETLRRSSAVLPLNIGPQITSSIGRDSDKRSTLLRALA